MKKEPAKKDTKKTAPITTVEGYLASVPADMRAALEKLRNMIRDTVPAGTEEVISYGVPTFKYNGSLVSFGAAKNHCGFYIQSPKVIEAFKEELAKYDTAPGTIRFPPHKPLPAALVKKLVKARLAENEKRKTKAK